MKSPYVVLVGVRPSSGNGTRIVPTAGREWMVKRMTSLEHYFENLLYRGADVNGDVNKNALTADEQNAVEVCADYVKYTMCGGDAMLLDAILHDNVEPVRHGRWIKEDNDGSWSSAVCSVCGRRVGLAHYETDFVRRFPYCHCKARMDGEQDE